MAWSSGPAPPVSAPTASLLVVPASVSASLPPAQANANSAARQDDTHSTERNSDTNAAATGPPHADTNPNTNYWGSAWSFANADTELHRRSAWSSTNADSKLHNSHSRCEIVSDSHSAPERVARTRPGHADTIRQFHFAHHIDDDDSANQEQINAKTDAGNTKIS
jgi:hypothetical protein